MAPLHLQYPIRVGVIVRPAKWYSFSWNSGGTGWCCFIHCLMAIPIWPVGRCSCCIFRCGDSSVLYSSRTWSGCIVLVKN